MNEGHNESREDSSERALEEHTRRAFEESVDALDAATLSRLNRARRAALAADGRDGLLPGWRPLAAAAAVAMLAVGLWLARTPGEPQTEREVVVAVATEEAADLEIVLEDEDLDMLAELEFYGWVDSEDAFRSEPAGNGNIG